SSGVFGDVSINYPYFTLKRSPALVSEVVSASVVQNYHTYTYNTGVFDLATASVSWSNHYRTSSAATFIKDYSYSKNTYGDIVSDIDTFCGGTNTDIFGANSVFGPLIVIDQNVNLDFPAQGDFILNTRFNLLSGSDQWTWTDACMFGLDGHQKDNVYWWNDYQVSPKNFGFPLFGAPRGLEFETARLNRGWQS